MYESLLKVNLRIEILIDNGYSIDRYPSRIEEVRAKTLLTAIPMRAGVVLPIHSGEVLNIHFIYKDEVYSFETLVLGRRLIPIPVLELSRPSEIKKIQRRRYVRLRVNFDVDFRLVNSIEPGYDKGMTVDISGGGLQFTTKKELSVDDIIELRVSLPGRYPLETLARVVRVEKSNPKTTNYSIGAEFENLRESQRDLVIAFVFEKQREILKKGLT